MPMENTSIEILPEPAIAEVMDKQPIARVTRDGTEFTLLGTAHVSRASVAAVRHLIENETF